MPDWRGEYLVNLDEAERRNPVNQELITACSQLADRLATIQAENEILQQRNPAASPARSTATATAATPQDDASTSRLRLDLAEALRARGALQAKLKTAESDLSRLREKAQVTDKHSRDLRRETQSLATRLKDCNEELKEKNKLLKDVQDDNLALTIQINVSEEKAKKVRRENKELVDRWMRRMEQEANAMNLANEPKRGR